MNNLKYYCPSVCTLSPSLKFYAAVALFSIAFLGHLFRLKIIDESSDSVLLKYGLKISQISQENTCAGHY